MPNRGPDASVPETGREQPSNGPSVGLGVFDNRERGMTRLGLITDAWTTLAAGVVCFRVPRHVPIRGFAFPRLMPGLRSGVGSSSLAQDSPSDKFLDGESGRFNHEDPPVREAVALEDDPPRSESELHFRLVLDFEIGAVPIIRFFDLDVQDARSSVDRRPQDTIDDHGSLRPMNPRRPGSSGLRCQGEGSIEGAILAEGVVAVASPRGSVDPNLQRHAGQEGDDRRAHRRMESLPKRRDGSRTPFEFDERTQPTIGLNHRHVNFCVNPHATPR